MALPHQTGTCRSGDVTLFYRRLGKRGRTPIVFVHGLSYFSWDWLAVAAALNPFLATLEEKRHEQAA